MRERAERLVAEHPPASTAPAEFLDAQFDAGLAWVQFPAGLGGLAADPALQGEVDATLRRAGAPTNNPQANVIGLGMAAPTIVEFAAPELQERWLKPLWTGREIWCQLFSEPGAGSDLANVATSARLDGEEWVVNGQKVWTSLAHDSRWALLVARTDPDAVKHAGLTYFVCDMTSPGVEVRPLRQATGEAEFNEVFLDDVRVPDRLRLGARGEGWRVTSYTLANERMAIGGAVPGRESGPDADLVAHWRDHPAARRPELYDELLGVWADAEALRLASARAGELAAGPGPDGSGLKLAFSELAQRASSLLLDVAGPEALRYDDWSLRRPDLVADEARVPAHAYLRNRANSIEGGTSEIMRNIIAERVLGLPAEARADRGIAWRDLAR